MLLPQFAGFLCCSMVSFQVSSSHQGAIKAGDPLAPSLFIIAEEALSRGLSKAFCERRIGYYKVPRGQVTHLLFANDTLIWTNGGSRSVRNLISFIKLYDTGQLVNASKSCFLVHHKAPTSLQSSIQSLTGFQQKSFPLKYLDFHSLIEIPEDSKSLDLRLSLWYLLVSFISLIL